MAPSRRLGASRTDHAGRPGTSERASRSISPPAVRAESTVGVHPWRGRCRTWWTFRAIETPPIGGKW